MKRVKTKKARQGDPKLAVAYLRVSTEEQANGPVAQWRLIRAWASREGVRIVAVKRDRASGGLPADERPGIMAALAAVQLHGAGVFVAAKRDRIARDVTIAGTIERAVSDLGARVVTADGVACEDTPEGRLMRSILDAFAEYERAMIRLRTRLALQVKKSRGERVSRWIPLGFKLLEGRIVEDPKAMELVASIKVMRSSGASWAEVASGLQISVGVARRLALVSVGSRNEPGREK